MGSIDLQIAALQTVSPTQVAENASAPAPQATTEIPTANRIPEESAPKAQQDTVSLSGTRPAPQRQQNAPSSGNAQPATFALLTHTVTFPPSQNSTAAFITAAFPPGATPPLGENQAPAVIATSAPNAAAANVIATSAAQAGTVNQSPIATSAAGATATPTGAPSTAPAQQTLQQLDRVLQQLGIDPQSLSLVSREGMLNWVNDPAALRQIVQNVQAAASSSQQSGAVGAANPTRNAAQASVASANQDQIQPQTLSQPQAAVQETNPASDSPSTVSSANTNALDQSAAAAQQNTTAMMQFQKLQDSLAPSGTAETQPAASTGGTPASQGQLLNVSA
jgi:hypothetical protein